MKILKRLIIIISLLIASFSFNTTHIFAHVTAGSDTDNDDELGYQDDSTSASSKKGKKKKKQSSGLDTRIIYDPNKEPQRPDDLQTVKGGEWFYIGRSANGGECNSLCSENEECHGWHNHLENIKDKLTKEEYESLHGNYWRCIPRT